MKKGSQVSQLMEVAILKKEKKMQKLTKARINHQFPKRRNFPYFELWVWNIRTIFNRLYIGVNLIDFNFFLNYKFTVRPFEIHKLQRYLWKYTKNVCTVAGIKNCE